MIHSRGGLDSVVERIWRNGLCHSGTPAENFQSNASIITVGRKQHRHPDCKEGIGFDGLMFGHRMHRRSI